MAGTLVDATTVPLEVSLNSQQYVPVDVPHMRCHDGCHGDAPDLSAPCPEQGHRLCGKRNGLYGPSAVGTEARDADARTVGFAYYGAPNVTLLSPTTGPALGGPPALLLAGTGLHSYGGVHGGSHYRCRFDSATYTTATVSASLDEVYCVAPAGAARNGLPVALALNGQQFHAAPSAYDRLASAAALHLAEASPTSGPIRGGTLVSITLDGSSGHTLGGGDDYRCRFGPLPTRGNDTRTSMYDAEYALLVSSARYHPSNGSVTCYAPPTPSALLASAANFTLQLAMNRLHFEPVCPWEYYDDAFVSSVSPASGPLTGGAQLMLIGSGFERGSHPNCWLGRGRSNATAYEGGSRLRCVSPPANDTAGYTAVVRVSLNAQQASDEGNFSFYPTPGLRELVPDSADAGSDGEGALVRVLLDTSSLAPNATLGTELGTDFRCRFGGTDGASGVTPLPPSYLPLVLEDGSVGAAPTDVRPATRVSQSELRCTAPRAPVFGATTPMAPATTVPLRVSLNGQQYGPARDFDLLQPPQISHIETGWSGRLEGRGLTRPGAPSVYGVEPKADGETDWTGRASGEYDGGALVEVHGHHFANRTQVGGRLSCRFGAPSDPATPASTVEATFVNAQLVRCFAPSADAAGLVAEYATEFDEPSGVPPRALLLGHARLHEGQLELTLPRPKQRGGLVVEPINRGARFFDASFGVLVGGGVGSDGVSFCYGELSLSQPFGELAEYRDGTPVNGLCVGLRTHMHQSIELRCNGTVLAQRRIGTAVRMNAVMPMRLTRLEGAGARATFEPGPGGVALVLNVSESVLAPLYAPTRTWRFGFGARTGELADAHVVDALTITSAAFVASHTMPFSVANNGQQFTQSTAKDFEYYAPPEISSFRPTSGPAAGDTLVHVYGAHLANGHAPYCRFPMPDGVALAVNASRVERDGGTVLVCLSPVSPAAVTLNAQQYTRTGLEYDTVLQPAISALSPSCGPTDGQTRVNVSGTALHGGSSLRCRLTPDRGVSNVDGAKTVVASRDGDGSLLCETPSLIASVASFRVAPNAQQFSAGVHDTAYDFAYYPPPVVSIASPSSGPSSGGTVVVVHGSHLTPTATGGTADPTCDVVCQFGELVVAGQVGVQSGTVTCVAPRNDGANGTALPLSVSLNRQQYSRGSHVYHYTSPLGLSSVTPRAGPVSGGTLVTARAHDLRGGDDYTCRFTRLDDMSSHIVNATQVGRRVLCTSPPVSAAAVSVDGEAYNFTVSLNRQDYRTPLPFTYYGAPSLDVASPASGPIAGGTHVRINGTRLAGGDNYTCRFGDTADARFASGQLLNLIAPARYNESDGMVHCVLPASPAQGRVQLRVAHNAQQYAPAPLPFELYMPLPHFVLSPSSGPAEGGTRINITADAPFSVPPSPSDSCSYYAADGVCDEPWTCAAGTDCTDCAELNGTQCGLRPGTDRRCRFAPPLGAPDELLSASVAASVVEDRLLCVSPAVVPTEHANRSASYAVHVSLNGQQYTAFGETTRFDVYAPPTVSEIRPVGGPSRGGTTITVSGSNLHGGSDYRCEIGDELVPASYAEANRTVLCTTPRSLPEAASGQPFSVRLNGQETVAAAASVTYMVSPHPLLDSISPSSGPLLGNTTVRFRGAHFLDTSATHELRCRFGVEEVPGTFEAADTVACVAPHAAAAGATATMDVNFGLHEIEASDREIEPPGTRAFASGMLLLGSAIVRAAGYGEPYTFIRLGRSAYDDPGAVLLPAIASPPHLGAPEVVAPWFKARFDVRMWGSASAHGLSFCYGDLPRQAWGESGASLGLCVQFATLSHRVLVHAGGHLVHNVSVGKKVAIRNRLWRGVLVLHDRNAGLHVSFDGQVLIRSLVLPEPLLPTATWRFGFGARVGPNVGQLEERHDVRNFRARLGALVGDVRLVPQLTLNGQQYVGQASYDYYPYDGELQRGVTSSSVSPASGPTSGGTYLTVRGFRLHGGSDYRCRFSPRDAGGGAARVQAATLVGDEVLCNASSGAISAPRAELLEVSLNGQQYASTSALNYSVHAAPALASLSPSSGPALGDTLVTLRVSRVEAPANHTCRFGAGVVGAGPVVVNASVGAASDTVQCRAPAVVRAVDPLYGPRPLYGDALPQVPLEYSLNAQQYTEDGFVYAFGAPPVVSAASPTSGPMRGGTRVTLRGANLWAHASDRVCRFADALVNASRTAVNDELLCVAPASPLLGSSAIESHRALAVSLNAQQFSADLEHAFMQYQPLALATVRPASGPSLDGGTSITISGEGLDGRAVGSHPSCAFTAPGGARTQLNATRLTGGALRCVSPAGLGGLDDPMARASRVAPLSLSASLNGQQFSPGLPFSAFYPHNVSLLTPDAGVYLGGTVVNVSLSHRALNASGVMECRFGPAAYAVPATLLDSGEDVRCVAPSSMQAGALPDRRVEFDVRPEGATFKGRARMHRGVLQLTPKPGHGSFLLRLPNLGGSSLTVAFDLLLGTGGGANGVSLVYGPVPTLAFGESGTKFTSNNYGPHTPPEMLEKIPKNPGLEVWIRTGQIDVVQIWYNEQPQEQSKMYGAMRTDAFLNTSLSISPSGDVELVLGNGVLVERVKLPSWDPQPDWRFGIGGSCTDACDAPENAQWVDNLVVRSDAFVQTVSADVCVALNGQQCLSTASYAYNALWRASHAYPQHGPIHGGTAVTVHGSNFPGGAADEYSCRFGSKVHGWREVRGSLSAATADGEWGRRAARLVCHSPPAPHAHEMSLELQVSINRQEYPAKDATLVFFYYDRPVLDIVTPVAGPTAGGTLVRMYGTYLHGGASGLRRCRLGDAVVPASLDMASGALLCFSPTAPGGTPAEYPLEVALNSEDFTHDQPTFGYYAPPEITGVAPSAGFSNGTEVTLTGSGLWRSGPFTPLCRFGSALTNSSRIDDASIRCVAPAAAAAGAWSRMRLTFSESISPMLYGFDVQLRGRAEMHEDKLLLVRHDELFELIEMVGTLVLAPPHPALAPFHFKASFRLKMGGAVGYDGVSRGADGVSFSYGDLSSGAIGEAGAGRGLRVCFRTSIHERVEVWYDNHLLHTSSNTSVLTWPPGHTLRATRYVDVLIEHGSDGLTVAHKGVTHAQNLPIRQWRPQPGWRFAIGARSGEQTDDHFLDDVSIDAGGAFAPEPSPLSLTLNGLQYTNAPTPFVYARETAEEAGASVDGVGIVDS